LDLSAKSLEATDLSMEDMEIDNLGEGMPSHTTILHMAVTEKIDVVCIQEPWTLPGSKTQNHPGCDCYAPIDSWDSEDLDQREAERPRVMTYVRKGASLKTQQRRPIHSRDMLWFDVNGYSILNVYRQPLKLDVIDYVTYLSPPSKCLVGGDFNAWHDMFEPGIQAIHQGAELARWATESRMDFIGTPGAPTQRAGHVLNLTFSNVPFGQAWRLGFIEYRLIKYRSNPRQSKLSTNKTLDSRI
jgi:hypothetical protein